MMIPSLVIGAIVLMFAIIFIGGILLGVTIAGQVEKPKPSRAFCNHAAQIASTLSPHCPICEHAAEMAGRSLNGLDGVHGRPAA